MLYYEIEEIAIIKKMMVIMGQSQMRIEKTSSVMTGKNAGVPGCGTRKGVQSQ